MQKSTSVKLTANLLTEIYFNVRSCVDEIKSSLRGLGLPGDVSLFKINYSSLSLQGQENLGYFTHFDRKTAYRKLIMPSFLHLYETLNSDAISLPSHLVKAFKNDCFLARNCSF